MSLIIKGLTKEFDGKTIFENFSYVFPEKGIVAVKGESGIGKTTLIRIISGLDQKYDGIVNGGGISQSSVAFQEYRLFSQLTALENVIYSISDTKSQAVTDESIKILSNLGFSSSDMNLLPSELSGGMKQRVSLARAFIKKCPILILDEPTKELDQENISSVHDLIRERAKSGLVIIVTHREQDIVSLNATVITIPKK